MKNLSEELQITHESLWLPALMVVLQRSVVHIFQFFQTLQECIGLCYLPSLSEDVK